jgi:hypothetical protein
MEKAFMETENVYVVLPSPKKATLAFLGHFLQNWMIFFHSSGHPDYGCHQKNELFLEKIYNICQEFCETVNSS